MLWKSRADEGITTKAGLLEFLTFAETSGLSIAVATSSDREYTEFTLKRAGLSNRFRVVVTGDEVARGKPAPDIYLEAARRLGLDPTVCAALEDSDAGILAASRAGMIPLLIPDVGHPSAEAAAAAMAVLASLHDARALLMGLTGTGSAG
jgi:HAD superfamily hydrolase (TIGR01509 family)